MRVIHRTHKHLPPCFAVVTNTGKYWNFSPGIRIHICFLDIYPLVDNEFDYRNNITKKRSFSFNQIRQREALCISLRSTVFSSSTCCTKYLLNENYLFFRFRSHGFANHYVSPQCKHNFRYWIGRTKFVEKHRYGA